jgi:hypothetical protein
MTGTSVAAAVAPDGTFRFANTGGAPFRPYLYGTAGMYIAQMTADGAPFKNGVVDLTESVGVHLNIVASDELGELKGFAMNGDKPVPAALVVLAPLAGSANPADYSGFQTESDGSFDWVSVPAGDYLVFAVDKLDLEYTNPEVLRPYIAAATRVHVTAHSVSEQRIPLSTGPKN